MPQSFCGRVAADSKSLYMKHGVHFFCIVFAVVARSFCMEMKKFSLIDARVLSTFDYIDEIVECRSLCCMVSCVIQMSFFLFAGMQVLAPNMTEVAREFNYTVTRITASVPSRCRILTHHDHAPHRTQRETYTLAGG